MCALETELKVSTQFAYWGPINVYMLELTPNKAVWLFSEFQLKKKDEPLFFSLS